MAWIRRHPLLSYFLLAYLFTWAIEVPVMLSAGAVCNRTRRWFPEPQGAIAPSKG